MSETQEKFEDAESYNQNFMKDKLSFRDIILSHVRKISQFASVEFRGGYWDEKIVYVGNVSNTIRTYISDTREIYSNAIENLSDMLFPYFDSEMKEDEEVLTEELKEIYNKYSAEFEVDSENIQNNNPKIRGFNNSNLKVSYRGERQKISRRLFRALSSFLYRAKYLELGSIED